MTSERPCAFSTRRAHDIARGCAIEAFRRLVQQPERRVAQEEAGEGKAARLTAREPHAAFAKRRVEAARQSDDVAEETGGGERPLQRDVALHRGSRAARLPRTLSWKSSVRCVKRVAPTHSTASVAGLYFGCEKR